MISYQLCKEFQALSPFDVDVRPYVEVIKLYADVRKIQMREKRQKDPNRVFRKKAGDDWF